MQVVDSGLLRRQRRQLVEVRGEQAEAADLGGDVFADGPGQPEAVVRGRPSAKLVDDDERALRGRAAGDDVERENRRNTSSPWGEKESDLTAEWQPSPTSQT